MKKSKVAVLLSCYNGEKYIREQIDSILGQTGNFELQLIVRDDGSTDRTKQILDEYKKKNRIEWYGGSNLGPAKSFLDLLYRFNGYDYYAFSDQDDVWMSNKIDEAIRTISKYSDNPVYYFSNAVLVGEKLNVIRSVVYNQPPRVDFRTITCAGGALGCTSVINNKYAEFIVKHRKPEKIIMHDAYLLEVAAAIKAKVIYDPMPTMLYRQHEDNSVGVAYGGKLQIVKKRLTDITTSPGIGIAEQAEEIGNIFNDDLEEYEVKWLDRISKYKTSLPRRISLSLSNKVHFININMGLTIRGSILLGNR